MGRHQQGLRSHQAQHPLLVDGLLLDNTQGGPEAAIAPKRVLGFAFLPPSAQACMTLGDQGRRVSAPPRHASLFCHARVSSPTRGFHRAFSRAKRASFWAS